MISFLWLLNLQMLLIANFIGVKNNRGYFAAEKFNQHFEVKTFVNKTFLPLLPINKS